MRVAKAIWGLLVGIKDALVLLFMFDGKERPKVKRGSKMGKSGSHGLAAGFKKLLDIFGFDWREVRPSSIFVFLPLERAPSRRKVRQKPSSHTSTKLDPSTPLYRTTSTPSSSALAL